MRFARTALLGATTLAYLLLGPVVLLLCVAVLAVPRVRAWLRPGRRALAGGAAVVLALLALVLLLPDGRLPLPPGSGRLVAPAYVGRPARPAPVAPAAHQRPAPGPLGDTPDVDTAWFAGAGCGSPLVDGHGRLVTACRTRDAWLLRVLDPETLRPLATKRLPGPTSSCEESALALDADGRAVVATADHRLLRVATADGTGAADLTTDGTVDLTGHLADGDCVVGLLAGTRTWWVTRSGRVGTVDIAGRVRSTDLGEEVANPMAAGDDGVYVVTVEALHKLRVGRSGDPRVAWRTAYDRGTERKPGQATRGSGTTPTVLPGGLVVIADNADRRMHVVYLTTASGQEVCRAEVFGEGQGATEAAPLPVGDGAVVVENNHGAGGAWRTVLGRTTAPGLARVEVADDECDVVWTADHAAPGPAPAFSPATGLVYAHTKPRSWWGVDAWYLTALDARTGRTAFAVRTGLGPWAAGRRSSVTLGPDGTAYVPVLGGLVAVRDRPPGPGVAGQG